MQVENIHLTDAYLERRKQIKGMISFHSYSQLWLLPFGDQTVPPDYDELVKYCIPGKVPRTSTHPRQI